MPAKFIMRNFCFSICALISSIWAFSASVSADDKLDSHRAFLTENCLDCHTGSEASGGLDLENLGSDLTNLDDFDTWVKVYDRVDAGEMPPPEDYGPIEQKVLKPFTDGIQQWLAKHQSAVQRNKGRVSARRLTNLQLERSLHDLLGIDIPLEREMPEEPKSESYSTLARVQSISHFHLQQHMKIVDMALDEAFRRALTPADDRKWEMNAKQISRTRTRTREPEHIDGQAVVWSGRLTFYGRIPATTAKIAGWYRFQFEVESLNKPEDRGVWCTVRTGQCVSSAPLMSWVGSFEASDEPKVVTVEAWLPAGHMLQLRPNDVTLKQARFQGGQSKNGEGGKQNVPGLAINWLNMERIHLGPGDEKVRAKIFGELRVELPKSSKRGDSFWTAKVLAAAPNKDARELIERFAERAFRREVADEDLEQFCLVFESAKGQGESFVQSLRAAYRAVLCSARFLYLQESPGELDDYALATRLSYFLWNSTPDERLLRLAGEEKLGQDKVLRQEVRRMLAAPRGQEWVKDFAKEWLELSEIDFTDPDRRLYPDFDMVVQNSMVDETHAFLQDLLTSDMSVRNLVSCDYTFVNSRLAQFYGLSTVQGDEMRRVELAASDHRGGLLTQGAILKVTANGTNTSPVVRGVWISRRILGEHIPPPPDNVPAIEPDIRGARTIREQLEKHRSLSDCAACHAKIDAPGFALENFDAAGRWRDYYPKVVKRRVEKGIKVDASYVTAAGQEFAGFEDFRDLISADEKPLARNFAEHLAVYGTGAEISFADRAEVQKIVEKSAASGYGVRSILEEVVLSKIFRNK